MIACDTATENSGRMLKCAYGLTCIIRMPIRSSCGSIQNSVPLAPLALGAATAALHVVERLTRVDGRSLLYEFTITDPNAYTKPWSGAFTIHKTDAPMYEFACHEGNYSIVGMLRGARAQDPGK